MIGVFQPVITEVVRQEVPHGHEVLVEVVNDETVVADDHVLIALVVDQQGPIFPRDLHFLVVSLRSFKGLITVNVGVPLLRALSVVDQIVIDDWNHAKAPLFLATSALILSATMSASSETS